MISQRAIEDTQAYVVGKELAKELGGTLMAFGRGVQIEIKDDKHSECLNISTPLALKMLAAIQRGQR